MYNLGDDNELDRISREAAGRYTPPGEADWQSLSEELDRVMPQEKKRRFIFWWILPVLLAGGGMIYVYYQEYTRNYPTIIHQSTNDHSGKTTETSITQQEQTVSTTEPVQNKSEQKLTTPLPLERSASVVTSSKQQQIRATSNNKNASKFNASLIDQSLLNVQVATAPTTVQEPTSLANGTSSVHSDPITDNTKTVEKNNIEKIPATEIATTNTENKTAMNPVEETKAESTPKTNKNPDLPKRGKGLSFSILAGVDKSTVKFTHGEKAGYNVGMEIAYHLNDKWAIKTGAIYTQKNYKLDGKDFTAPKGTPVSYYNLDLVQGYCKMWEIPLTASYTLSSRGKHAITLNSGLSSYFMKNEEYNYYYQYNGNPVVRNANYNSTDTHILSILHLSAGIENRIGKNSSLIIEPYAKLPLGGVGFGSIKLSSFGVNFSMQLRQPTKK